VAFENIARYEDRAFKLLEPIRERDGEWGYADLIGLSHEDIALTMMLLGLGYLGIDVESEKYALTDHGMDFMDEYERLNAEPQTMTIRELYKELGHLIAKGFGDQKLFAGDIDDPHTIDGLQLVKDEYFLATSDCSPLGSP
jgi:hypothetical protein